MKKRDKKLTICESSFLDKEVCSMKNSMLETVAMKLQLVRVNLLSTSLTLPLSSTLHIIKHLALGWIANPGSALRPLPNSRAFPATG